MKSIFNRADCQDLLSRLDSLQPTAARQWGKMSAAQMLEHSARAVEMATGRKKNHQMFVGKLIGWIFKKDFVGEKPFSKNGPTGPDFVVREEPDFVQAKQRLRALIEELHALGEKGCDGNVYGFFGKMTGLEWGITQHKHLDHHFRQFGV